MANNSSSSSSSIYLIHCADAVDGVYISIAYYIIRTLLFIPLCTYVLHLGYRQWRQQRSFATTSHSDIFTYHMVALEMLLAVGCAFYFYGRLTPNFVVMNLGFYLSYLSIPGQISFHVLTCLERYLAVVHPVLYMKLKQSGPGKAGRNKERVNQSKQKAFYTISFILASLWLWFGALLVGLALDKSTLLSYKAGCLALVSANWFGLPCNLVSPLLFLHRARKLTW
ncbi:uncharacterized protein LOC123980989 isoform X1 [Xyrichtys novacula]|uniref:Uncharacterized protein LOC123980989 isoform X1 n=1 Tax=Xyrichtys novacula TaxID=13765 RepID=A0AAV1EHU0_XYRNO|nr:uncharacterized protein LOC123980989 isoform X1 [Xyrichtys novacula]